MNISGIVKENKGTVAVVKIVRSTSCGENCASCGMCSGHDTEIEAINLCNAYVGDTVTVHMADKKVLGAAFLVYIIPLICLILGYAAGFNISKKETAGIVCGFLLMFLAFVVIHIIDKKIKKLYLPAIKNVIVKK